MTMPTELDHLELELRSLPGVVAVGFDHDFDGEGLVVQVVVLQAIAPGDLRARVRRALDANVRGKVSLELVIDNLAPAPAPT